MMNERENRMNTYLVYQLPSENPKMRDLFFMEPEQIEAISDEFEVVAEVNGSGLDEVFRLGNFMGDDAEITENVKMVAPMRSVSVGDIIVSNYTGYAYVVTADDFVAIEMKEAV
jgi:hypothetical protein